MPSVYLHKCINVYVSQLNTGSIMSLNMIDLGTDCLICFDQSPKGIKECAKSCWTCGSMVGLRVWPGNNSDAFRCSAAERIAFDCNTWYSSFFL